MSSQMATILTVVGLPPLLCSACAFAFPEDPVSSASVPLALVYCIVAALSTCYYLQVKAGKMQKGVYFPAISQLGIEYPEMRIYQLGMVLVSACMVVGMLRLEDIMLPHYLHNKNSTAQKEVMNIFEACRKSGLIAAAGVSVQGLFTLELALTPRSFLHWGGTGVFAYGAFQHCEAFMRLLDGVESPLNDVYLVEVSCQLKHLFLERVPSLLFFLPILGQIFSAAGFGGETEESNNTSDKGVSNTSDDHKAQDLTLDVENVIAKLPDQMTAKLSAYMTKLEGWVLEKLQKFDKDEGFRASRKSTREQYALQLKKIVLNKRAEAALKLKAELDEGQDSKPQEMSPMVANSMGAMQWMMIGMFVAFFGTYSIDLYYASKLKTSCQVL